METEFYSLPNLEQSSEAAPLSLKLKQYLVKLSSAGLWQALLLGGAGLIFGYAVMNMVIGSRWINQPFAGFLHQNRVVSEGSAPGWEGGEFKIGAIPLEEGDFILAVAGQAVPSSGWLVDFVRQQPIGRPLPYLLLKPDGSEARAVLAVARFTLQDFSQQIAIPGFIAFIILAIVGATASARPNLAAVKLISLFSLALACALISLPGFISHPFAVVNFSIAWLGKIVTPSLLVHFLLVAPRPRPILKKEPMLLPLIYLPVLPALIHLPMLLLEPATTLTFQNFVNLYTAIYMVIGLLILGHTVIRSEHLKVRKQARALLVGLALPAVLLLSSLIWVYPSGHHHFVYQNLERYALIGLPIGVVIAIIRYEMFNIRRGRRAHFFYMGALLLALLSYIFLLAIINNFVSTSLVQFQADDIITILATSGGFLLLRPVYGKAQRWVKQLTQGNIEDFKVGLRLFSHNLLNVKSRRDMESLVSWDVASDFRLRSAELSPSNRPTIPYALALPLSVSNISLGTFFLGTKINGQNFTEQELEILAEMQKQAALALWSIELDEAIRSTEQLTQLKNKFLANVTHELRTPLNGIINYIGFALDDYRDRLNFEQASHLEQALQGAEKLLEIINNILDMSKIEAGQMKLYLQPVNLAEVIARLNPLVQEMIKAKAVQFSQEIEPDLPLFSGDQLRLRQIVLNLLSNAAKFTQAGQVQLRVYTDNNQIVIQVSDTGIGITGKALPTIFQQFISADLSDARQELGAGLSMPITKALVELHHGQITVKSQSDRGTTFTVTLPIRTLELPARPALAREAAGAAHSS
jgi:signal transduction histidine kinase